MRWVGALTTVAVGSLIAWIIEPNIWFLTLTLVTGAIAADRGIALLPIARWWRLVSGVPFGGAVFMIWLTDGRLLALLLWLMALGMLRLAMRGLVRPKL